MKKFTMAVVLAGASLNAMVSEAAPARALALPELQKILQTSELPAPCKLIANQLKTRPAASLTLQVSNGNQTLGAVFLEPLQATRLATPAFSGYRVLGSYQDGSGSFGDIFLRVTFEMYVDDQNRVRSLELRELSRSGMTPPSSRSIVCR